MKQEPAPGWLATSGFLASVDEELCTACALCEDRCPVGAIEVAGEVAVVNDEKCIGCALCATGCDTDAVEMVRRIDLPATPTTMPEMGVKILESKGKLEEFIEINK